MLACPILKGCLWPYFDKMNFLQVNKVQMQYLPLTSGSLSAAPVTIWSGGPIGASFSSSSSLKWPPAGANMMTMIYTDTI